MKVDQSVFAVNGFAAIVDLPCKVFCQKRSADQPAVASGVSKKTDRNVELLATAVRIDSGSVSLDVGSLHDAWQWEVGEQVRLELHLPVHVESAKPKALIVRARVESARSLADGTTRLELTFRKPRFRDRDIGFRAAAVAAAWTM